jgi:FAD/FMN-containing dehydrogenase
MVLQPSTVDELRQLLGTAYSRGEQITGFQLNALNRIVEHTPEDMTVSAEAGITMAEFQSCLVKRGQWLPIDPPHSERMTIGGLLAMNASGPRRFGYGTIRDHLIGIKVALADGRIIKAGGKVVKNVAGYDLCKLFVGSFGSLGIIVEGTFKLRPVPEKEQFVEARFETLEQVGSVLHAICASELTPIVVDLHNLSRCAKQPSPQLTLVLGFAGTRDEVAWQIDEAGQFGLKEPSSLDHQTVFWDEPLSKQSHRLSILPSKLATALNDLGAVRFVARAGNGVIYYRDGPTPPKPELPIELMKRVKDTYDPKHILPDFPQ